MLAQIRSAALTGLVVHDIEVEIDAARGLPAWEIVGLPDAAVKESKERVSTAIKNAGFDFPARRIIINLAPAHLKKEGPTFDLPIAVAILAATEQIPLENLSSHIFVGELGLDGSLRRVNGLFPIALFTKEQDLSLVTATISAPEGATGGCRTYGFDNLKDVAAFLKQPDTVTPHPMPDLNGMLANAVNPATNFADIRGQHEAKRALEIAASGGHNVILIGSPGAGKTMLARAMPGIMPPLTVEESLQTTKVHSVAGLLDANTPLVTTRPFRAPHHSCSPASLIGGGRIPTPGEVSLAHHGILFMDEFPEYRKDALESLRQPLEDGVVTVSRVQAQITYPCRFLLVASMNPCPCGYLNDPKKSCDCTPHQIHRYHQRISGPLLDRFDIHLEVIPVAFNELYDHAETAETSEEIRARVVHTRLKQLKRFHGEGIFNNAGMQQKHLQQHCQLDTAGMTLLQRAFDKLGLSARGHNRILKLARTIADLSDSDHIEVSHLAEALQYRALDKKIWQN